MKPILTKKFRLIFLAAFLLLSCIILTLPALAAYEIEFGIPNMPAGEPISDPAEYIRNFFIFGITLVGFLAVAAIAVGGVIYMTGGTIGKVEKGKEIILGALTGVLLLLCSYLLLWTIDPTLVNLSPFKLPKTNTPNNQATPTPIFTPTPPIQTPKEGEFHWYCPNAAELGLFANKDVCKSNCTTDCVQGMTGS